MGNEWMKVGLVKPGVPMDIVLNTESKRKTNAYISLRDNAREFSSPAMVNAVKYPQYSFGYMMELLGEQVDSPAVKKYTERFPHHKIQPHPTRGTVVFTEVNGKNYTIEELLAQVGRRRACSPQARRCE